MNNQMDNLQQGHRLSFIQLFQDFDLSIEIPIIQRDYAQGRQQAAEVRETFLQALFHYLESNRPFNDLDFVYGSVSTSKKFIPLDGQQRLTTLFLLHWYLALSAGKQQEFRNVICRGEYSRFTYETRSSSREFCDALVTHQFNYGLIKDSTSKKTISVVLQDQPWFFMSWCFDPTIQAMLNMLDAIHLKFRGFPEFYQRLTATDSPVITFRFLNLKEFSLTDDLYIKMNARGKPLTPFENFKAKLEQKIQGFQEPWPTTYRLSFKKEPVSGYDYFIHKIDNEWADVFWPFRNTASVDNTFDDELMNFIGLFIAQHYSLRPGLEISKVKSLFFDDSKIKRLSFDDYDKTGVLSQSLLIKLIAILDLLSAELPQQSGITRYLPDNPYYQEIDIFKKVLSNSSNYTEKLRFFAFYSAVANGKRDQELVEWMRVVFNLTEHTIFNDINEYQPALASIRELVRHQTPILELLRDNVEIKAFAEHQVFEEKLKAHLLIKSSDWRDEILQLEQHTELQGQIGFVLKFAGVVDYFLKYNNVAWATLENSFLDRFKFYALSAAKTFDALAKGSKSINYAWERAVLCKGMYFIQKDNKYNTLHSTRVSNARRDYSWYRLLRLSLSSGDQWNLKQRFVQQVFDDPLFDPTNILQSLESICTSAIKLEGFDETNWRHLLITNPSFFDVAGQGFVVQENDTLILLHQSQRNHNQSEIRTLYLHEKLKEESFDAAPFNGFAYAPQRGVDIAPRIEFTGFHYQGTYHQVNVSFSKSLFTVTFTRQFGKDSTIDDKVRQNLKELGFVDHPLMGILDIPEMHCTTASIAETKTLIQQMCIQFKGLLND